MSLESLEINDLGANLCKEVRDHLHLKVENLHKLAPSDSRTVFVIEKCGKEFLVTCDIHSRAGDFSAKVMDSCPDIATETISSRIKEQLYHWKENRFSKSGSVSSLAV